MRVSRQKINHWPSSSALTDVSWLTPMSAPTNKPIALMVVTSSPQCGSPHCGPTAPTSHATAGKAINASHLSMSYTLPGSR